MARDIRYTHRVQGKKVVREIYSMDKWQAIIFFFSVLYLFDTSIIHDLHETNEQ